jgi:hypothetical protein
MIPGLFDHWTTADFLVLIQSLYNEARCKGMPRDEEIEEEIRDLRREVEREVEG